MKKLILLLLLALPVSVFGQAYYNFGMVFPRNTDTARTFNTVLLPKYANEDGTKFLTTDERGLLILVTVPGGGDADSSIFSTVYGVDTAKEALRGEIATNSIANQSDTTQTATFKIDGTGTAGNFVATKADGANIVVTNTNTSTTTYPALTLQVTGQNSGGMSVVPKDASTFLNRPWTDGARGTALLLQAPGNMYFRTLGTAGAENRDYVFYTDDGDNIDSLFKIQHDGSLELPHAPEFVSGKDTFNYWDPVDFKIKRSKVASSGISQSTLDDSTAAIRADFPSGGGTLQQTLTSGNKKDVTIYDTTSEDSHITWYGEPSNYGVDYGANGKGGRFSQGWTDHSGAIRPNVVGDWWSYNILTPGSGIREFTDEAAFRFAGETDYLLSGGYSFEFHLPEIVTSLGVGQRPLSMYIRKESGYTQINSQSDQWSFKKISDANIDWAILSNQFANTTLQLLGDTVTSQVKVTMTLPTEGDFTMSYLADGVGFAFDDPSGKSFGFGAPVIWGSSGSPVSSQLYGANTVYEGPTRLYNTGSNTEILTMYMDAVPTVQFSSTSTISYLPFVLVTGAVTAYENTVANNYFNSTSGNTSIGFASEASLPQKLSVNGGILTETSLFIKEISAPSTPASGYGVFYTSSDGRPYFKNDDGIVRDLTLGRIPVEASEPSSGNSYFNTSDGTYNVRAGGAWYKFTPSSSTMTVIDFPTVTNLAESPDGVWRASGGGTAYGHTGLSNTSLIGNGRLQFDGVSENGAFGFYDVNAETGYAGIQAGMIIAGSLIYHIDNGALADHGGANPAYLYAVYRNGSVFKLQSSADNGESWTDIYTYTYTCATGDELFIVTDVGGTDYIPVTGGNITNPKLNDL